MTYSIYVPKTHHTYFYGKCKDKALAEGLEPPFDFRQEKKETK